MSLYEDENGMHCHRCSKCGSTWQHPEGGGTEECNTTRHGREDAHACPKPGCKGYETWKTPLVVNLVIDYPWEAK
jgi:hypothetical protein